MLSKLNAVQWIVIKGNRRNSFAVGADVSEAMRVTLVEETDREVFLKIEYVNDLCAPRNSALTKAVLFRHGQQPLTAT